MRNEIKVGVVGAGYVANDVHLPSWNNIKNARVVAICDTNRKRAERTAKKWNIPYYTNFDELLEESKATIIDLCTPPFTHAPLGIEAMRAGFNVLIEKPLAMKIEESTRILNEYKKREKDIKLYIIHNLLFNRGYLDLKSILERKDVEILGVDIRMHHPKNEEMISNKNHWCHSLPGGRFGECLIHPLYILHDLLGHLEVRDIWTSKRGDYNWVKYDELLVTFNSNRKFGSIYISFNSPRLTFPPTIRIYGKNVILNFDGSELSLTIQSYLKPSKSKVPRITKDFLHNTLQITKLLFKDAVFSDRRRNEHEIIFKTFIESILENKQMPYTIEEAYMANKIFLEILNELEVKNASTST